MIAVQLQGQLGNQMFQYAAARLTAERLGVPLMVHGDLLSQIDPSFFDRGGVAGQLGEAFPAVRQSKAGVMLQAWRRTAGQKAYGEVSSELFPFMFTPRGPKDLGLANSEAYDNRFAALADGTVFYGFFQSERYLKAGRAQVLEWYTPAAPSLARIDALERSLPAPADQMACIHLRRGDYLTQRDTAADPRLGWALPQSYYDAALARIPKGTRLAVFSDDPDYALKTFGHLDPWISRGETGLVDMMLMARCRYMIIANSSMSWWSAWLNSREDRMVIAPKYHLGIHIGRWVPGDIQVEGWTYV